jgi:TolB protein
MLLPVVLTQNQQIPGGEIAFMRGGRVWLISADGSSEHAVTEKLRYGVDRPLIWSPHGNQLLYWSHSETGWDIWAFDPRAASHRNLTHTPTGGSRSACWSPDGLRIAYVRDNPTGVYVMDADGSNQTRLTTKIEDRDLAPTWSPDGSKLAFTRISSQEDRDAGGVVVLAIDRRREEMLVPRGRVPLWSADGSRLLVLIRESSGETLQLAEAGGSGAVKLIDAPGHKVYPAWSPDNEQIAVLDRRDKDWDLVVVKSDGQRLRRIVRVPGEMACGLCWSPDGKHVAFSAGSRGQEVLRVVRVEDGEIKELGGAGACFPAWRRVP